MPIPDLIVTGFLAPALVLILLLTPLLGLAILRGWRWTWPCGWWLLLFLLVLPLGAVTQLLWLTVLLWLAAFFIERDRRAGGVSLGWRRQFVRAVAGAGAVSVLGHLYWTHLARPDEWTCAGPVYPYGLSGWTAFLLAEAVVVAGLLVLGRREWRGPAAGTALGKHWDRRTAIGRLIGGAVLLVSLSALLSICWARLPLQASIAGFYLRAGIYLCVHGRWSELGSVWHVAGPALRAAIDLLAAATLLLWLFQLLWVRLIKYGQAGQVER